MRVPSLSLPRPCAITQFQTETFWRNRLSPERLRESIQYLAIAKSLDYSFAIFLSWYLKNKVPPIAISKTDPTTINVFIFFCYIHEPFPKFCFHRQKQLKDSTLANILHDFTQFLLIPQNNWEYLFVHDKILPLAPTLSFRSHPVATTRRRFRLNFWNQAKVAVPLPSQTRELIK